MAVNHPNDSDAEEYHSLSAQDDLRDDGDSFNDAVSDILEPPIHPVPSMQTAFEESIIESTEETTNPLTQPSNETPEIRRRKLLEAHRYDPNWKVRWKQRPTAQHHPLRKLMAQILFGMHLLQQNQAKSNEEVIKILQTHVDEVDTFLERTGQDFDCAIADIDERIHHLELPMSHLDVFKSMLDDKRFRTQLLEGNDKIEKIVDRTARATFAALADVQQGIGANKELGVYLDSTEDLWPQDEYGIADVCIAMRGNEQGWMKYLENLLKKGDVLNNSLIQLSTITGEMSRLAAAASRRNKSKKSDTSSAATSKTGVAGLRSKFYREKSDAPDSNLNKPLPREPRKTNGAVPAWPRHQAIPMANRYESPREHVPAPHTTRSTGKPRTDKNSIPPKRPKTAGSASRHVEDNSAQLAEFLRTSGPLRSNPPEIARGEAKTGKTARSQSQSAADMLNDIQRLNEKKGIRRSKSQTAMMLLNQPAPNHNSMATNRPEGQSAMVAPATNNNPGGKKESVGMWRFSTAFRSKDHKSESGTPSNAGMTRRLSKRTKPNYVSPPAQNINIPQRQQQPPPASYQTPPMNSEHSSSAERRVEQSPEPQLETVVSQEASPDRPPSRLSLFPKPSSPPTNRPTAGIPRRSGSLGANAIISSTNSSTAASTTHNSPTPGAHGRTMSLRNIFHRRHNTEGALA